jgi:hypothetical protein
MPTVAKLLALAVALAALAGCSQTYGTSYKVTIVTAGFSDLQIEQIAGGGDLWINAIPALAIDTETSDVCPTPGPGVVCIEQGATPTTSEEGYTNRNSEDHAHIVIDLAHLGDHLLTVAAAHELGHAMGLEHAALWCADHAGAPCSGTIMDATTSTIAIAVTPADVAQFNTLRNL